MDFDVAMQSLATSMGQKVADLEVALALEKGRSAAYAAEIARLQGEQEAPDAPEADAS